MHARQTLLSIQYLRGLAALMVVAYHCFSYGMIAGIARDQASWLKHGVAIFFVISGYVMVVSIRRSPDAPALFLRRRLLRIAPLYWLATLALFVVGLRNASDLALLPCSLLFVPCSVQDAVKFGKPVLDVGWTLVIEMFFYAIFACSMLLPRQWSIAVTAVALTLVGSIGFIWPELPVLSTYSHPRLFEFVAGMLLAHWGVRLPAVAFPIGCALLVTLGKAHGPALHSLCVSLPAILIVGGALGLEDRLPVNGLLHTLGDASYAIYLTHYIVLNRLVLPLTGYPAPIAVVLPAALVLSAVVGILVHRKIEQPLHRLLVTNRTTGARKGDLVQT
jgi:exopolysaccharide production protein ExoZ